MQPLEFVEVSCPSCGDAIELQVDSSIRRQEYIQDCEVCCRPMRVTVAIDEDGEPQVDVRAEDE